MLNAKRLLEMASRRQKGSSLERKTIISMKTNYGSDSDESSAIVASRGHLFIYTTDGKRFMIPLAYLTNKIFRGLFRLSEEEFGLPSSGPITFPCDATCMEYIISLLRCKVSVDVQGVVLGSILVDQCSLYSLPPQKQDQRQQILYGL